MRVLWVEDFGDDSVPESILDTVFEGVLSAERRDSLAGTQTLGAQTKRPQGYAAWRDWHGGQSIADEFETDIYRRAQDFDDLVKSGYLVDRYDAALLDVNLENDFFEPDPKKTPAQDGFWLYNKLVGAGFPSNRIALLTAHNSETPTTDFKEQCRLNNHEELRGFDKQGLLGIVWVNLHDNQMADGRSD